MTNWLNPRPVRLKGNAGPSIAVAPTPTPSPTPTPTPTPTPSAARYNGDKPAVLAWDVANKFDLKAAITSKVNQGGHQTIVLRGNAANGGANYCVDLGDGEGRTLTLPYLDGVTQSLTLVAADFDDMPKFTGSENKPSRAPGTGFIVEGGGVRLKGLEIYDDETNGTARTIWYTAGSACTADGCFIHGTLDRTKPAQVRFFDLRGGKTDLLVQNSIFAELQTAVYCATGTGNDRVTIQLNSFLRMGEHVIKAAGGLDTWLIYRNAADEFQPGYIIGPPAGYDDHANFMYFGPATGVAHSNVTTRENLFFSETDQALGNFSRFESGGGTYNDILFDANKVYGKGWMANVNVRGANNKYLNNIFRTFAGGELSATGIRFDHSILNLTGNDGSWIDDYANGANGNSAGSSTITDGGGNTHSGPDYPTYGSGGAQTLQLANAAACRTAFEADCLALKLKTTLTTGL